MRCHHYVEWRVCEIYQTKLLQESNLILDCFKNASKRFPLVPAASLPSNHLPPSPVSRPHSIFLIPLTEEQRTQWLRGVEQDEK